MTTVTATDQPTRMTSAQRRDQILAAARTVFAENGYAATTDEVARAAGVSQPYVIRLFGSKRNLCIAVAQQAADAVITALSTAEPGPDGDVELAMGKAYLTLIEDQDVLRLLMHSFMPGTDDEVRALARHCLGEAYRLFIERTGQEPDEGRRFVASGMLLNVLVAVNAVGHRGEDAGMDALIDCVVVSMNEVRSA
jgi:AcrR family transcriptional regulator